MRAGFILTTFALAAVANAQVNTSLITEPIPITGTNISPPPTGSATRTTLETQSPRPSLTEAPTESFPSFSEEPTSEATEAPTESFPSISQAPSVSSVIASATSALSSGIASITSTRPPASPINSATSAAGGATQTPNAGVPVQVGAAGWTFAAVVAGVAAGAVLV